jgi:ATP-dependent exoDNAse (exonuclease V) alpha subunit
LNDFWDTQKEVPKYQAEKDKSLQVERCNQLKRPKNLDMGSFYLNWNIEYDYECSGEDKAIQIVVRNKSIHIDGMAGTGKTYLTNKVIEELNKQGKKFLGFSPTNKGARLIGGETIDSVYHKFKHNKRKLFDKLKGIEYIIIDEVSMMKEMFYQLFSTIKITFPKIKFILTGDFSQFKPVKDTWDGDYKNSPATFILCDGNRLQLNKCRRSDSELFNVYTKIQNVDIYEFPYVENTYLNLSYKHSTRIRVNHECQERFLTEHKRKSLFIPKDELNNKTQDVNLCVGMPVICHKTHQKKNKKVDENLFVLNSERFKVKEIKKDVIILDGEREIEIHKDLFHKYFYLGFCITLHSSQGETFKGRYTIYDWDSYCFDDRAKYVGLSRGITKNNIQIVV